MIPSMLKGRKLISCPIVSEINFNHLLILVISLVVIVSGCSQKPAAQPTPTYNSTALSDLCIGAGNVTAFTLDPQGGSLERFDQAQTLQIKCTVFTKCTLEPSYNLFNMYALSLSPGDENKIFNKTDFSGYISVDSETDNQNKTTLRVADKTYTLTEITTNSLAIGGKKVNRGDEFAMDGFAMKYYQYAEKPVFLVLLLKGSDVKEVINDPQNSGVSIDPNGFGVYSILIRFSPEVSERLYSIVKDMPTIVALTQNGPQAIIKSKIYYFVDTTFISSAPLPAQVKADKIETIAIRGIGQNPEDAYKEYKFITSSLKLYTYPEIKVTGKKQIDCRDVQSQ